jgi:hypothetical protein
MSDATRCSHVKPDGERCRANAGQSGYCFAHDPSLKAKRDAARKAGGRKRARGAVVLPTNTPDVPLNDVADVVKLLGTTINQCRRGQLDTRAANAIGQLSSVLLRALTEADVEQRLAALEAALKVRGNGQPGKALRTA